MSSTNKTTNYELSQFLGTDKPAWLTDYNSDMTKIDAGIHSAQGTATGADGKADANTASIGTLTNLTTDAQNNLVSAINEVDSHADSAQGTANNAGTIANSAKTKADGLESYLNINTFDDLTFTVTGTTGVAGVSNPKIAVNTSKSLAKIYGRIRVNNVNADVTVTIADTGLRPTSAITINGACMRVNVTSGVYSTYMQDYTINTDGTITLTFNPTNTTGVTDLYFWACLLFIKDFGDIPTPE